ncbi:hypothetical protein L208DRAFT_1309509 [Tricholoma matsutake]|nr:hypothetical protein L208DRAFT_1309509 [Tricholoma matsutake 945]
MSISHLQRILKHHVQSLVKAKGSENVVFQACDSYDAGLQEVRLKWPSLVLDTMKDDIASLFCSEMSSDALREVVCACCAESVLLSSNHVVPSAILDLDILRVPVQDEGSTDGSETDSGDELAGILNSSDDGELSLRLCGLCSQSLHSNRLPCCALANRTFLGEVPSELQDLTFIEESVIALCHAKAYIIQLKGDMIDGVNLPNLQCGMKGHVIIYPQKANVVAKRLPPSIQDIVTPICVLFV